MTYDLTSCIKKIKFVIDKKKTSRFSKKDISCKNPLIHGCILGQGSFGTVCYVEPKQCNPPIADLNPLALKYIINKRGIKEIEKEVKFLNDLQAEPNPVRNVLKIYPINTTSNEYIHKFDPENFCIATQYLNGKDLYYYIIDKYVRQSPSADYTRDQTFKTELDYIAQQLILTLKQIHDKQILHLDIKPENILLDNSTIPPRPVFIDFGLAITGINHNMRQTQGTPRYKPDVRNTTRFNDIYSLGRTLVDLYNLLQLRDDGLYDVVVSYPIINDLDENSFIDSFNYIEPLETIKKYDELVEKINAHPIESRPNPDPEVDTSAIVSTVKKYRVGKTLYNVFILINFLEN